MQSTPSGYTGGINLKGKWFTNAGYKIGDNVLVCVNEDEIIIKKIKP